jgi:hypothetical protein
VGTLEGKVSELEKLEQQIAVLRELTAQLVARAAAMRYPETHVPPAPQQKAIIEHLREAGKKGAAAQKRNATPQQLRAWGRKGAKSRWAKKRKSLRDET